MHNLLQLRRMRNDLHIIMISKNTILKQQILDAIRRRPMSFFEIQQGFNIDKGKTNNLMYDMKRIGLVDLGSDRKYFAISEMTVSEAMAKARNKAASKASETDSINTRKADWNAKFSPHASMKVTCNDYPTHGNKQRLNVWSGYTSFSGV